MVEDVARWRGGELSSRPRFSSLERLAEAVGVVMVELVRGIPLRIDRG
jgi:hypothetical protein